MGADSVSSSVSSIIMNSFLLLSVSLAVISAQESFYRHNPAGDTGEPYVHDTTGDFGPFYYWKLRQQARKEQERSSGGPKPQPQAQPQPQPAATKRKVVSVRKQPQSAPTAPT